MTKMKKQPIIVIVFFLSLGIFSLGFTENSRKTSIYAGIVGKVDVKSKTVEVIKENSELGLAFDVSNAKFEGYKSIKSIKRGDKVTVEYDVKSGKTIAVVLKKDK